MNLHEGWSVGVLGFQFYAEYAGGLMAGDHDYRRRRRGSRCGEPEHDGDEPVQLRHPDHAPSMLPAAGDYQRSD